VLDTQHEVLDCYQTASVVWWSEFLATDPEVWVGFPALPDFLRSSGSGIGFTQPREYNNFADKQRLLGIIGSRTQAIEFVSALISLLHTSSMEQSPTKSKTSYNIS
jgi:hypothetical protein